MKDVFSWLFSPLDQNKLMRQRLKYIKKGLEIDQKRFELQTQQFGFELQKFSHQVDIDIASAEQKAQLINLKEQENQIRQDEAQYKREFYVGLIEIFNQYQRSLIKVKSAEIQANWDLWNLPFIYSREETLRIFQRGPGLLILLAPPRIPEEIPGFAQYLKTEIEDALSNARQTYYSAEQNIYPVDFYLIFKKPIEKIEASHTRGLITRPTLILSSEITDKDLFLTITAPIDIRSSNHMLSDNQRTISWNWEDLARQLESEGKDKRFAIRVVRDIIVTMHVALAGYFADLYFLGIDPFYIPKIVQIINTLPANLQSWLSPYSSSILEIQRNLKINALSSCAEKWYKDEDYINAAHAYKQLMRLQPSNMSNYYAFGHSVVCSISDNEQNSLVPLSYYQDAADSYEKAFRANKLNVDSDNYFYAYGFAEILSILALSSEGKSSYDYQQKALLFYNKIIRLAGDSEDIDVFLQMMYIYSKVGYVYLEQGRYKSAYNAFGHAISHDNKNTDAWIYRSVAARELGRLKEATWIMYRVVRMEKKFWLNQNLMRETRNLCRVIYIALKVKTIHIKQVTQVAIDNLHDYLNKKSFH